MYSDLINEDKYLNENDYVYVIQACTNIIISKYPLDSDPCPICGDFSWIICEGIVKDIKKAKSLTHLQQLKEKSPVKIRKRIKK